MLIPGSLQYIYGYRYNPNIANEFSLKLEVIRENLKDEELLVLENYNFYKILEDSTELKIINTFEATPKVAILGRMDNMPEDYQLERIITSPMRDNSDIIYLYTYTENKGE